METSSHPVPQYTHTDSVLCVLIDITLSALRKDISISTKSEFNSRVYACV